jgi:hypothetical protein
MNRTEERPQVHIFIMKEPPCLLLEDIEEIEIENLKERVRNSKPC